MTLSDMASFITAKLNDTDASSVSTCKDFIKRRYELIWNSSLWLESVGAVSHAVAANDTSVTLSEDPDWFYYPTSGTVASTAARLDFPVAVRFIKTGDADGRELVNGDWWTFFQFDPNAWENDASHRATPSGFVHLPKNASGYCRFKLVPTPDAAGTLFVLGKMKLTNLSGDTDSPTLRGVDNALIAYAEGDMLERSRQYGKAQAKYAEGAEHVRVMRDMERGQQQAHSRIVPMVEAEWGVADWSGAGSPAWSKSAV